MMNPDTEQTNPDVNMDTNASTAAAEVDLATAAANAGGGVPQDMDWEGQLNAQKEKYLRLAAEYENYRKRTLKETQQASARGQADLLRHLLTSLDDLSRFAHVDPATTTTAAVVEGVALVEKNLLKVLSDIGVEIIDPVELPFDPNLHEAVSTQAAESPDEDHMVAQVFQRGYMLKGQLLRPARVVVKQYLAS